MDLNLFINQLNQMLQTSKERTYLLGVCELLRIHTSSSITLINATGHAVIELLHEDISHGNNEINLPINDGNTTLGKLKLFRADNTFSEEETQAAKIALSLCTVLLKNKEVQAISDKKRRLEAVRAVINTLSFSELDAATHVLKALGEKSEGLLVAGHIADKLNFTRSIVTGALRKLEGAGLIETRSLGMKGTYIRVKDSLLVDELGKL